MMMCDCIIGQVQWWGFSSLRPGCAFNWTQYGLKGTRHELGHPSWVFYTENHIIVTKVNPRLFPCCEHLCLLWVLAIVKAIKRASAAMLHNTSRHNSWVYTPCLIFVLNYQSVCSSSVYFHERIWYVLMPPRLKKWVPVINWGSEGVAWNWMPTCADTTCRLLYCFSGKCPMRKKKTSCELIMFVLTNVPVEEDEGHHIFSGML